MSTSNYYNILEVAENASPEEIKKAYRRLSMIHHPDKNNNNPVATENFKKIAEAYETLGDPDKKKEYDMTRSNPFFKMMGGNGSHHTSSPMDIPIDEIFSSMFGMPFGPFGPTANGPFGPQIRVFHNGMPVNMGPGGFSQGLQKPTPIIKTVVVPIDKILTGTTIPMEIERWIIADNIKAFENETIYLQVPQGIDDGEIIILRDKGNMAREDCRGDIKVFIKIENNTDFKRSGLDLLLDKNITVKEALCGFNFELKYITGKTYTITNQSGNIISHGYRKIIPNMGFTRDQHVGNLIILFNVQFPEKLSVETMEELKKIDF